jgi:hypothetical protein
LNSTNITSTNAVFTNSTDDINDNVNVDSTFDINDVYYNWAINPTAFINTVLHDTVIDTLGIEVDFSIGVDYEPSISDLNDVNNRPCVTLTDEQFSKLDVIKKLDVESNCSICLDEMCENLIKLECNHMYHKECLKKWVMNSSTKCCICRFDIRDTILK